MITNLSGVKWRQQKLCSKVLGTFCQFLNSLIQRSHSLRKQGLCNSLSISKVPLTHLNFVQFQLNSVKVLLISVLTFYEIQHVQKGDCLHLMSSSYINQRKFQLENQRSLHVSQLTCELLQITDRIVYLGEFPWGLLTENWHRQCTVKKGSKCLLCHQGDNCLEKDIKPSN